MSVQGESSNFFHRRHSVFVIIISRPLRLAPKFVDAGYQLNLFPSSRSTTRQDLRHFLFDPVGPLTDGQRRPTRRCT